MIEGVDAKTCRGCGLLKRLGDYHVHKTAPLGRHSRCKSCILEAKRVKERNTWCQGIGAEGTAHFYIRRDVVNGRPPKVCPWHDARVSGWKICARCEEAKPVSGFAKGSNKDGYCQSCRTCSAVTSQSWARANPGASKRWAERNPEKNRAINARAAARRAAVTRGADADESLSWRDVAKRDGMNCAYCGVLTVFKHEDRKLWPTLDHVVPLQPKTGPEGRHSMDNAVLACFSCNCSKGNKRLDEWAPGSG